MIDWNRIFSDWLKSAVSDASDMLHCHVEVESSHMEHISADQIVDTLGGSSSSVVGIYQRLPGEINQYIMIAYKLELAHKMLSTLFDSDLIQSRTLIEIRQSAVCELCNLIMKTFIATMTEVLGLHLKTSLPLVMVDAADAIKNIANVEIVLSKDNVFVVDTILRVNDIPCEAKFVVMLCDSLLKLPSGLIAETV